MQHPSQRVAVFVDVQNMYYSARALYDQRVDFGEILQEAVGNRHLVRAFAYVIQADNEDEHSFFAALQDRGYELRSKELLNFHGGASKGDWDVGLAMDVVRMSLKVDAIVVVSGDGDFAELLQYVKAQGCRAEVMAFGASASSALRAVADAVYDLSQDTNRFLIPKKHSSHTASAPAHASSSKPAVSPHSSGSTSSTTVSSSNKQSRPRLIRPSVQPPKPVPRPTTSPRPNSSPSTPSTRIQVPKIATKRTVKRSPRIVS